MYAQVQKESILYYYSLMSELIHQRTIHDPAPFTRLFCLTVSRWNCCLLKRDISYEPKPYLIPQVFEILETSTKTFTCTGVKEHKTVRQLQVHEPQVESC